MPGLLDKIFISTDNILKTLSYSSQYTEDNMHEMLKPVFWEK